MSQFFEKFGYFALAFWVQQCSKNQLDWDGKTQLMIHNLWFTKETISL